MAIARWLMTIGFGVLLWLGLGLSFQLERSLGLGPALAQDSARLESRLNRLESDLGRLSGQVRQIQSQLAIPNRPSPSPPVVSPSLNEPSLDEQFDNLAILVIELRQQLRQLETRVGQLEGLSSSPAP